MKKLFIPYELALIAKEKGFNEECIATYTQNTLGEAENRVSKGEKIFIKPIEIKLFTGLVLDGFQYTSLKGLPDDTMIMAYKPFETKILSEWRIYVNNNKIIDSRNYSGDFKLNPKYNWIEDKIFSNYKFPCAYTVDIGILDYNKDDYKSTQRENVIIEYNDMWAIGNYGIPNDLYLQLLKERYFEIVKK